MKIAKMLKIGKIISNFPVRFPEFGEKHRILKISIHMVAKLRKSRFLAFSKIDFQNKVCFTGLKIFYFSDFPNFRDFPILTLFEIRGVEF